MVHSLLLGESGNGRNGGVSTRAWRILRQCPSSLQDLVEGRVEELGGDLERAVLADGGQWVLDFDFFIRPLFGQRTQVNAVGEYAVWECLFLILH